MKKLLHDIGVFCRCKVYVAGLMLIAVCAYGYAVIHYSIGMDDTAIPLYFEEGLAPYVGRWSMFLLNKIIPVTDFAPWVAELVSVLILMLSVTLWCILWKRVCEPAIVIPIWSYVFVAGIFLSCPLISEIFVFYLHNGICLGYGITALALLCFTDSLAAGKARTYRIRQLVSSAVLLSIALGFYESFLIVYVMGAVMCFFLLRRFYGKREVRAVYSDRLFFWGGHGMLAVSVGMIIYKAVSVILKAAYHLDRLARYNVLYRSAFGDIFTAKGETPMILKRLFLKYYVNAVVYLPITVLVCALLFIGAYALYFSIRKKDMQLSLCMLMLVVLPVLMGLVEGLATRYRSAQYVPLVGAFAVFLVIAELYLHRMPEWLSVLGALCGGAVIFMQCVDMTGWFRLDYLKYCDVEKVMSRIADDLEEYDISTHCI